MSGKIIHFISQLIEEDQGHMLMEIQGSITHTIESRFSWMLLGKLTKKSEVNLIFLI